MKTQTTTRIVSLGVLAAVAGGSLLFGSRAVVTPAAATSIRLQDSTSRPALDARIAALRERVAADPGDGEAAVGLADALMRAARVQSDASLPLEAERALKATLQHGADYAAQRMLAAVYLSQHRFREGLDIALKAQAEHPQDAWNYAVAGDALLELGSYDQAFDMFDKAMALRPDAGAYARIAYAKELRGDLAGALDVMRIAAEATAAQDTEARAWVHAQLGLLSVQVGRLDDAERDLRRAEFFFPGHPYVRNGRIRVLIARGHYADALDVAMRAPDTPETLALRGDLLLRLGDAVAAEASYVEAERLERDGWQSEEPQPAALARFLAERNRRVGEAVVLAERAAGERDDIHTMDALAWSYFKAGRVADASRAIRRALRTGTADPRIRCHAAAIATARRTGETRTCDPLKPL
jgi:tetratricopeptide (TPR) repeat protein